MLNKSQHVCNTIFYVMRSHLCIEGFEGFKSYEGYDGFEGYEGFGGFEGYEKSCLMLLIVTR